MQYEVFDFSQINNFDFSQYKVFKSKGKKILNAPIAFDIETSSFFIDKKTNSTITLNEYDNRLKKNPKYDREVIDYIVLHEYCHLKYKSHCKSYIKMLEKYEPNYKKYERFVANI